jgi:hypothetical protein
MQNQPEPVVVCPTVSGPLLGLGCTFGEILELHHYCYQLHTATMLPALLSELLTCRYTDPFEQANKVFVSHRRPGLGHFEDMGDEFKKWKVDSVWPYVARGPRFTGVSFNNG